MRSQGKEKKAEDSQSTKATILRVAEEIFAQRGFDGARVEEIARQAGINQAMIYYYFKSKDDLLEEVIKTKLEEVREFRRQMKEQRPIPALLSTQVLDFINTRSKFLKILLMETVTSAPRERTIFRLLDLVTTEGKAGTKGETDRFKTEEERRLAFFFFAIMPVACFSIFQEQWSEYYGSDLAKDGRTFIETLNSLPALFRKGPQQPQPPAAAG